MESMADCPIADDQRIDFTLTDPSVLGAPHDYYRRLRDGAPVHFDRPMNTYLVSRYDDIAEVLRDSETYSQEMGWKMQFAQGHFAELKDILERDGGGYFPEVLLLDPPGHTRIRKLINQAFGAHRVEQLKPRIQAMVEHWVGDIAQRGACDGVNDFAMPLTIDIMCEQLGFPKAEAAPKIQSWARAYIDQVGTIQTREEMIGNAKLICELQHFIIARVREREQQRHEDMISDLVYAVLEDDRDAKLSFEETVALTRGLLLAGNDTTATAISNFLLLIATEPRIAAQTAEILDDNRQLMRFVEELLRLKPPVRGLFRYTTRDVELGGVRIPKHAQLCVLFASANDDERVFECPRAFDQARPNVNKHLAFGSGIHICAGMSLARMELRLVVREVLTRLKNVSLACAKEELRYTPSITSFTLQTLPLRFETR